MDKTININLGGSLFTIDEDAYKILRDYLLSINNRFRNLQGGHETVEDIESRIAEIFNSKRGTAGVITRENVESMMAVIGKPEDFDTGEDTGEVPPVYPRVRKRMYRNPDDSIISGVCGGIGAYLDTDPVLFRILFVVFTLFFGIGFFIYLALWVALPSARTEAQKKELFGDNRHSGYRQPTRPGNVQPYGTAGNAMGYSSSSRLGNAINEVFRAIGRVLFVIFRIFMIVFGIMFVLTGFLVILSLVMVLVFRFPGIFTSDGLGVHMVYYRDFLNYIVNPSTTPWIIGLTLLAVALPMLALIYGGVKMIFWLKVRDGIYGLAGFVLWVLVLAALAMIFFNEGISFAERGTTTVKNIIPQASDTLFIVAGKTPANRDSFKEFSVPEDNYTIYMDDSARKMYITPFLELNVSDEKKAEVEIKKEASGRTRADAARKAETIVYNYEITGDTLKLDRYFSIPAGSKWSADFIWIKLTVPENTVVYFGDGVENLLPRHVVIGRKESDEWTDSGSYVEKDPWELGGKFWIITRDGLNEAVKANSSKK